MDNQVENSFINFVARFDSFQKRSMFGGIGLFSDEAMYVLIFDGVIFLRGGGDLDKKFEDLGCRRYQHVKRQCVATVNYFDITILFLGVLNESKNLEQEYIEVNDGFKLPQRDDLIDLIKRSIAYAKHEKALQKSEESRRLRDLPNMQLTLERMLKKSGVSDVSTFLQMQPEEVFVKVRATYGQNVDIRLLWKFAGAIEGCHWKLIQDARKKQLLDHLR